MAVTDVAVLIRFCYDPGYDEAAFAWRLGWFRDRVLPRLLAQEGADFDLWLWTHPRHEELVRSLSPRIRTFRTSSARVAIEARHPWATVVGLPAYPIQFRLDSDDLIAPGYVRTGLAALARLRGPRAIAWFQPRKVDVATGVVYPCAPGAGRGTYSRRVLPAFLALRQPLGLNYEWVYSYGHTKLGLLASEFAEIPPGLCWAACHAHNDSTRVYPFERPIGRLELEP